MLGVALGLASSAAWGVSDFLGGLASRRMSALTVLLVTQPVGLVLALFAALGLGGDPLSAGDAAIAAGAGAAVVLALGAFYRAMALGSVSVVATIGALGVLIPVAAGVARGDRPGPLASAGAALAVGGVVLAVREPDPEWRRASRAAVGLAALAAAGFGAFLLGLDLASGPRPAWAIVAARAGGVATLAVTAALARPPLRVPSGMAPPLAAIAICDIGANSLFALATGHGLLALVAVTGSLYSAFTVLLARVVLGERLAPPQRAGVAIALAGVAAIAAGSA